LSLLIFVCFSFGSRNFFFSGLQYVSVLVFLLLIDYFYSDVMFFSVKACIFYLFV